MVATPNGTYVFAMITHVAAECNKKFCARELHALFATWHFWSRIIYIMSDIDSPNEFTTSRSKRVCPVERAGSLDGGLRRWIQNPRKILSPYVRSGMTVLDFGCGPGFFTTTLAELVGPSGHVHAVDLQEGMLAIVRSKIRETELASRISLHRCAVDDINLNIDLDFILAFYVLHEVPSQSGWFRQVSSLLRPSGSLLIVEPRFFHVSRSDFGATIAEAETAGLIMVSSPRVLFSRTALLTRKIC